MNYTEDVDVKVYKSPFALWSITETNIFLVLNGQFFLRLSQKLFQISFWTCPVRRVLVQNTSIKCKKAQPIDNKHIHARS